MKQRKKTVGGSGKNQYNEESPEKQGIPKYKKSTAYKVGKELGVSHSTIEMAEKVVDGLERAAEIDPEFKRDYMSGNVKATKKDIAEIGKLNSDEEVKAIIEELRNPTVPKVTSRTSGSKDQRIFNERLNAISAEMEKPKGGYTLDDAIRDLNSAEDVFINQVEFILRARKSVLDADERTKEALIGYIESVIHDLEELKGRF